MNKNPLVSVIIPTYNRAHAIAGAVKSVLAQTYTPIQLIVVDDGSTDNTAEIMKQYPSVDYIIKEHSGQAATRNRGLAETRGEIMASLDSDDIWDADFVERGVKVLLENDLDFVFANYRQQLKNGEWKEILSKTPFLKAFRERSSAPWILLDGAEVRRLFINTCPAPSSALIIRKASLTSNWNDQMRVADDWCLMLDMVLAKPCKAAFTMAQLWTKHVDDINIYDGRERFEVIRLVHVEDTAMMLERYKKQLTPEERKIIERRYAVNMMRLGLHLIKDKRKPGAGARLLRKAMTINPTFAIHELSQMLVRGVKGRPKPAPGKGT